MINTDEIAPGAPAIDRATINATASAHSRINLPLNLENWRHLPEPAQELLMWFHQHLLDRGMGWDAAAEALGYGSDEREGAQIAFRVLKGTFEGKWAEIERRLVYYRKISGERAGIQDAEFVANPITAMIWAGFDYALASNCITLVEGDSGHGKTRSAEAWVEQRASGRAVRVEVPSIGGTRVFLGEICKAVGANKNLGVSQMREAIFRAFNRQRILIVDEATRLLPKDRRSCPEKVEFLRELHDRTGCALALLTTRRLAEEMEDSTYLFEQVLGRAMPIRLPARLEEAVWRPILVQYFPKPTAKLLETAGQVVNHKIPRQRGRLRLLVQVLKLASRIASKKKARLAEAHFFEALALRAQMMGQNLEA